MCCTLSHPAAAPVHVIFFFYLLMSWGHAILSCFIFCDVMGTCSLSLYLLWCHGDMQSLSSVMSWGHAVSLSLSSVMSWGQAVHSLFVFCVVIGIIFFLGRPWNVWCFFDFQLPRHPLCMHPKAWRSKVLLVLIWRWVVSLVFCQTRLQSIIMIMSLITIVVDFFLPASLKHTDHFHQAWELFELPWFSAQPSGYCLSFWHWPSMIFSSAIGLLSKFLTLSCHSFQLSHQVVVWVFDIEFLWFSKVWQHKLFEGENKV